ncbi:MAG: glycoside hydrolase family 43 protein [Pelomonas sp.]|nr:glycoside hydrolase family 43 protein [Roseateles sp.]
MTAPRLRRRAVLPLLAGAAFAPRFLAAQTAGEAAQHYANPVLPGFHPDPSICRVGEDYYLATSSFEYFPGVPIHHSRDLVHWRLIGHALTRESQLPLAGQAASKGIFAPTLRWHAGRFYMVTTNIEGGGNFYVTATDPAGPWSEPVWLHESTFGMDPSLWFDDDGRVYYTRHGGGQNGGVYQAELDLATGRLKDEARLIWPGTGGIWPEGPHLFKREGWYYLLISEGGTSWEHSLTMARSRSPWGPFEPHPDNPILTHRNRPDEPLQMVGHADLVQAANGRWWLVLLGTRPAARNTPLGRETLLAPAEWDERGWLVVNRHEPIRREMAVDGLPPPHPWPAEPARDGFDAATLGLEWNFLRSSAKGLWSLSERPGWLRLKGTATGLNDAATPAFVGRRQTALRQCAVTLLDFHPQAEGQEAGLVLRRDEAHHVRLRVVGSTRRRVELVRSVKGEERVLGRVDLADAAGASSLAQLQILAWPDRYEFMAGAPGQPPWALGSVPIADLSVPNSFTGTYFGLYASGPGAMPPADFDWFELVTTES